MVDTAKYHLLSANGGLSPDHKRRFCLFKTRGRVSKCFAYGFLIPLVGYILFLAFTLSSADSSSPWLLYVFYGSATSSAAHRASFHSTPVLISKSHRSRFAPDVFPNLTVNGTSNSRPVSQNDTALQSPPPSNPPPHARNDTGTEPFASQAPSLDILPGSGLNSSVPANGTAESGHGSGFPVKEDGESEDNPAREEIAAGNSTSANGNVGDEEKLVKEKPLRSNFSALLSKKQGKSDSTPPSHPPLPSLSSSSSPSWVESLVNCDFYDGGWVRDESYPLYKPGSCELIDEQFNCFANGRPDTDFPNLKWKPRACSLPRLNGRHMMKLLRGKRLVFVGDSLNRNMWESLICILRTSVKDKRNVFEASGRLHFKTEAFFSFVFKDYNLTLDFYASPFLVRQWEAKNKNGTERETLRIDLIAESANQFKDADILVFNTGHWWTHEKTSKGQDYYQEGRRVHRELNVAEAFRRAMMTWARWIDANTDPFRTHVLFRGYSNSHFSGGQWNSGGACDNETEPISNEAYLTQYPWQMKVLESVLQTMRTKVSYLNVTKLTDYRKDGHPSIYRKKMITEEERRSPLKYQDCSHWCLPGVPDAWNELLYAELLIKQFKGRANALEYKTLLW